MTDRSDDPKRSRARNRKPESVEDWLAQRLAMLGDLDDADEADDDAPTLKARATDPLPRSSIGAARTSTPRAIPPARTIPPSRPGAAVEAPAVPFQPDAEALPELEAEPLATEDVEPLLTEEAEPIEAPSDTDEPPAPVAAGKGLRHPALAPDEAMWDLLGETTGSTRTVSGEAFPSRPDAPTEEAPAPKLPSRASLAPTIPPASIKVTPSRVDARDAAGGVTPSASEPPVRAADGDPRVDALIAEANQSPKPRRRRSAFSRQVEGRSESQAEEENRPLVSGETLTPEETEAPEETAAPEETEAGEPPSVTAGGFDEVFPISRGIPPVRARTSRVTPSRDDGSDGANDQTSALLATETGAPPDEEAGTQWVTADEGAGEKTQIRPALADTTLRPQDRQRKPTPSAASEEPTRRPFPAVQVDDPENAPTTLSPIASGAPPTAPGTPSGGPTPAVERRFYAPQVDDDDLAGTLPPEVSSAVITWGSVIIGVLMFFVTIVVFFAVVILPYLVV